MAQRLFEKPPGSAEVQRRTPVTRRYRTSTVVPCGRPETAASRRSARMHTAGDFSRNAPSYSLQAAVPRWQHGQPVPRIGRVRQTLRSVPNRARRMAYTQRAAAALYETVHRVSIATRGAKGARVGFAVVEKDEG